MHYPGICLEKLRNLAQLRSLGMRSSVRDLKPRPIKQCANKSQSASALLESAITPLATHVRIYSIGFAFRPRKWKGRALQLSGAERKANTCNRDADVTSVRGKHGLQYVTHRRSRKGVVTPEILSI